MKSSKSLSILLSVIVTTLTVVFIVSADNWTPPAGEPTANNTPAPIHVGGNAQSKSGGLIVGAGLSASQNALIVPTGNVLVGTINGQTAPNGGGGNVVANDFYITSIGKWVSQLSTNAPFSQGTQVFNETGTFTVPEGVYSVEVTAWGGGGGGLAACFEADRNSRDTGGSGGGGGAWAKKVIAVTPTVTYDVVVGGGGAGGIRGGSRGCATGGSGGKSSFGADLLVVKGGGAASYDGGPNNDILRGGAGGAATAGDGESLAGENGGDADGLPEGARGGSSPNGGAKTSRSTGVGSSGFTPGGGGGGGALTVLTAGYYNSVENADVPGYYNQEWVAPTYTYHVGGAGAKGKVIVTWGGAVAP
ncbi:MAG: Phage-related tail fiber protein-like protein [Candidatus Wolfebacteria bacterium GW2011_GWE2_44_13]|uniref:Phage-related tail fiber protein-like protein n=1 Tax=Candidatus Wolfebacteria bacterium GW2011_GWE2_44_13 TaxID=1619017 RepID=A0A0G1H7W7_9BACT|nr:MAG: Phage-related tail fiber protein-like protein [Candidatus Wolfebacteria bacterium GW2011_GWE2_44_13]